MAAHGTSNRILFRYQTTNSATGITRQTAIRLAKHLGVGETEMIHMALQGLAAKVLRRYEADDGALTITQLREIKKGLSQHDNRSMRSSLIERKTVSDRDGKRQPPPE